MISSRAVTQPRTWFSQSVSGICVVPVVLMFCLGMPGSLSAGDTDLLPAKKNKVVAAGLGFQNARSSSITVKTYDAESGEILSNDTYELDIKEEGPPVRPQPRERIFAGGVGIGADGLAEFTLRVYDADDGRFLWEGRLNLRETGPDSGGVRVAASVQPRSTVRRIGGSVPSDGQPSFLLRVTNPETGQLVWSDRFSAEAGRVRVDRISQNADVSDDSALQQIDFRIQMFDDPGGRLLWEDQVTSEGETADLPAEQGENEAGTIQQWVPRPADAVARQAI